MITVGGLRAARLENIQGLLIGEGLTASRNSAIPAISKPALAAWASEQARIISESNSAELYKAHCAEIVLECGGNVADLPLLRKGEDDWLSGEEFFDLAKTLSEVVIVSESDLGYDEDNDEMHPKEFNNSFELSDDFFVVPHHDGAVLSVGNQTWPRCVVGKSGELNRHLHNEIRRILREVWPHGFDEDSDYREIGSVGSYEITRHVAVLTPSAPPEEEE